MTPDDLAALLDFHYWARDRALDAAARLAPEQFMRELGGSFKSVRDTGQRSTRTCEGAAVVLGHICRSPACLYIEVAPA